MINNSSTTLLRPLLFSDGNAAAAAAANTAGSANTSASDGQNTGENNAGTPTPGEANANGGTPANTSAGENNNQQQNQSQPGLPQTTDELQAIINSAVTSRLAEERDRNQRSQRRQQNQQTRQQAEAANDVEGLLTVERAEHEEARGEVTRLTGEVTKLTRQLAVHKAATKHGLDSDLVALLENNGLVTDEATANAEAAKLAKYKKVTPAPETDGAAGNRPAAKKTPAQQRQTNGNDNAPAKRFAWQTPGDVAFPT